MVRNVNEYMRVYRTKCPKVTCDVCGCVYKKMDRCKHVKTNGHKTVEKFKSSFIDVNNLIKI